MNTKNKKNGWSSWANRKDVGPEHVWQLLAELAESQKRTDEAIDRLTKRAEQAEKERKLAEKERKRAEERAEKERKKAEAERKKEREERKKAEAERKKAEAERNKRVDEEFKRNEQIRLKAEQELRESLDKTSGRWNNKWGQFLENLVAGDFANLVEQAGVQDIYDQYENRLVHDDKRRVVGEFDLVGMNTTDAVGAEVKTEISQQDVDNLLQLVKNHGARVFRGYKRVFAALAFMRASRKVQRYALEKGVILIQAPGGKNQVSTLVQLKGYKPKAFTLPQKTTSTAT